MQVAEISGNILTGQIFCVNINTQISPRNDCEWTYFLPAFFTAKTIPFTYISMDKAVMKKALMDRAIMKKPLTIFSKYK